MKNILMILLISVLLISCKKHHDENLQFTMTGKWIETTTGKDTIEFIDFFSRPTLNLKWRSVTGSGPYEYVILNDSISMRWFLSSSTYFQKYYFKLDSQKQQFTISNFYDAGKTWKTPLTFTKMH